MENWKTGQRFRALWCRCSAVTADFCRFAPLFQGSCPVPVLRAPFAGPREVYV